MADTVQSSPGMDELQQRLAQKLEREFGAVVGASLVDPAVMEIMLNPDGVLWVERLGGHIEVVGHMNAATAEALLGTIAAALKTTITRENPVIECELPGSGFRFEGVVPPVVAAPAFTIRRKAIRKLTLEDYVAAHMLTERQCASVKKAVRNRQNILVVGGTSTGKTTLSNAILHEISAVSPQDRVVIIEDTRELECESENHVSLRTSLGMDQTRLLKVTMRLRPDRICVGEVRDGAALALLKAWNTGHPGGVCTVHANDARAGLLRLEQLIAEVSSSPMGALIAEAVNVVISIKKVGPDVVPAGRRIEEVLAVGEFRDGDYQYETL